MGECVAGEEEMRLGIGGREIRFVVLGAERDGEEVADTDGDVGADNRGEADCGGEVTGSGVGED
jgi:hypothetical protein